MEPSRDSPSKSANICELRLSIENHASDLLHDGIPLGANANQNQGSDERRTTGLRYLPLALAR
jgi:hypothetical protein